jgi:hypothetical protein
MKCKIPFTENQAKFRNENEICKLCKWRQEVIHFPLGVCREQLQSQLCRLPNSKIFLDSNVEGNMYT